ncbi:uncharacterized protein LY79DRAFT_417181 [Colletotrichum navitas]|uniref:Uncharacterized protein n=1 Tax=Colletotrichum navitas TaxID=681940 RepID=A0AAD8PMX4_9PEZI|nr:uncharacterized protein LY79DRAFT_417181 [Colletotrichum navitas]KAK1573136.1 hypothetical protein LY79DRAFT_417181 [Colletotrichum navitas]
MVQWSETRVGTRHRLFLSFRAAPNSQRQPLLAIQVGLRARLSGSPTPRSRCRRVEPPGGERKGVTTAPHETHTLNTFLPLAHEPTDCSPPSDNAILAPKHPTRLFGSTSTSKSRAVVLCYLGSQPTYLPMLCYAMLAQFGQRLLILLGS